MLRFSEKKKIVEPKIVFYILLNFLVLKRNLILK